ncbi:hypothetical protein LAZ67_X000603 [Cordylochernes scorpioides]|uniref:Transposase n=1 Tax=Cordylochernes scorpioides TaxID=51811 RepID=A0ABY6LUA9_9ARAC|nr:hypothetical protein LAZ67_X000603 [Cordylochernes scorpioides]
MHNWTPADTLREPIKGTYWLNGRRDAEFKRGCKLLEDDSREGRAKTATTPETIEKVHDIVLDDRRVKQCLDRFKRNFTDFVRRFFTMDETWVHHYTQQPNSSRGSEYKPVVQRRRKRSRSHLLVKITLTFLTSWMTNSREEAKAQDNAPAHKSVLAMGKLQDLKNDPFYFPDLAPLDFHLFPNLKKLVSGKRFTSN